MLGGEVLQQEDLAAQGAECREEVGLLGGGVGLEEVLLEAGARHGVLVPEVVEDVFEGHAPVPRVADGLALLL